MDTRQYPRRPGKGPVLASVAVHLVFLAAVWWGERAEVEPYEYVAYEMTIVSLGEEAPIEEPVSVPEPVVVERTDAPPGPEPQPMPDLPLPEPEPEPTPEPTPEPPPEPPPTAEPAPTPEAPVMDETTSAAAMAVRMEGLRRDFPEYYQRIVSEIDRCFRWNGPATFAAVVRFEIQGDGRVPGPTIRLFQRSGSAAFDIEAAGAVECAGMDRLGPLPGDIPFGVLPVQFTFGPVTAAGE